MARPKSDDRRAAIRSAAIRVIAVQGLAAPTATIAKEAGVSNGSLFTYFDTKGALLNQLYLDLKTEMASVALSGLAPETAVRDQLRHVWSQWLRWAASCPEKRRTLAQLDVTDDISAETHAAVRTTMARIASLLERSRKDGPLRDAPLGLVVALLTAMADATTDFMIHDPQNAEWHCATAFDAVWRVLT